MPLFHILVFNSVKLFKILFKKKCHLTTYLILGAYHDSRAAALGQMSRGIPVGSPPPCSYPSMMAPMVAPVGLHSPVSPTSPTSPPYGQRTYHDALRMHRMVPYHHGMRQRSSVSSLSSDEQGSE
jgi:hypothetical protein